VLSSLIFIVYISVLHTTARQQIPACKAISPGPKTHFANKKNNVFTKNMLIW